MGKKTSTSSKKALLACTFGWGKTCRLYSETIEIAGKSYSLDELTSLQSTYRNLLGVPSARMELCFGLQRLVLRGISDLETARLIVSHLLPYCSDQPGPDTLKQRTRFRSTQARNLARAQARAWERTSKLPAILNSSPSTAPATPPTPDSGAMPSASRPLPASPYAFDDFLDLSEQFTAHIPTSALNSPEHSTPLLSNDALTLPKPPASQLPADALTLPEQQSSALDLHPSFVFRSQPLHIPRLQPPLRSVRLIHPDQKTLDTCSVPIPALKSSILPIIHVPVHLQPGECAHYSIGATLCSDRLAGSIRAPYPALDHGLLILTNRRIFYVGKRSQLILAYTHLWYVSILHRVIALHIERQFRRIIIEVEHPREWASRIEQLAFIARQEQPRTAHASSTVVLPGVTPSPVVPTTTRCGVPPALQKHMSPGKIDASALQSSFDQQTGETCMPAPNGHAGHDYKVVAMHEHAPSIQQPATAQVLSSSHQDENDYSETQVLFSPAQDTEEYGETQALSPLNQAEDAYVETQVLFPCDQAEDAYAETQVLFGDDPVGDDTETQALFSPEQADSEGEDTRTIPLRKKITDIATTALRVQVHQQSVDPKTGSRRISRNRSRALSHLCSVRKDRSG